MTRLSSTAMAACTLLVAACGEKSEPPSEDAATPTSVAKAFKDSGGGILTDAPDPCDVLTRARATEVLGLPIYPKVKLHRAEGLSGGVCSWSPMTGGGGVDLHVDFFPRWTFDAVEMSAEEIRQQAAKNKGFPLDAVEIVDGPGKVNLMIHEEGMSMMLVFTGFGERAMGGVTRMSEASIMATINENKPDPKFRDAHVKALAEDLYKELEAFLEPD